MDPTDPTDPVDGRAVPGSDVGAPRRRVSRAELVRVLLPDLALAVGLFGIGLLGTGPAGHNQDGTTAVSGWTYALVGVAAFALVVRRYRPVLTLGIVTVVVAGYLVLGFPYGPILISYLVAVYTVATYLPIRRAAILVGGSLVLLLTHVFVSLGPPPGLLGLVPAATLGVVPFALGATMRINRESTARVRTEQARRLADDERLRIAQEVHDVVGHGLAAINLQAEIALHLLARQPEQAETALAAISRTSKEALDELRVTLAVVRTAGDRTPVPGLGRVEELRARSAAAGLPVTVEVSGTARELPAVVDLAAYRVVQESLTNVLRHAGAATTVVRIDYRPTEVTVEVTDTGPAGPGPGAAGPGAGHGLAGMRERVTALGGDLNTGPRPGGGFRVYARLPAEPRR
ncbi:histidine kinase [Micromonospora sp. NPDC049523]|uniref:sensor histidine kinase n=1 Tax=Micromonospora sp. NPDC049523 TaxID=3155921 RepID=UPI00344AAC44